ncbi:callose synthase 3-like [Apium graveolens]|uniref:callose synthase 3-like n=1 Tax=Apium graveolens TaxID=4045 RepID=UPI003D7C0C68
MFSLRFLKAVSQTQSVEVDREIFEAHDKVAEKTEIYVLNNIPPLDPDSATQEIMKYPENQAVVYALRNTRGLPWPRDYKKKKDEDILDWLQAMFKFQKDSIANQREHLILLLANVHIRQFSKPDQQPEVTNNTTRSPADEIIVHGFISSYMGGSSQLKIYAIYHHMAFELYGMLADNVSPMTGETVKPAYGGEEAFLRKVVTPIYEVIEKESARSNRGKSKHSQRKIYDDLNEYFWSVDCFRLGWPMRADADFFCLPVKQLQFRKGLLSFCVFYMS